MSVGGRGIGFGQTQYPLLAFSRANGDSVRLIRTFPLPNVAFRTAALTDDGEFFALGQASTDSTGTVSGAHSILCRYDSTGTLLWRQYYQFAGSSTGYRVLALPDGALLSSSGAGFAEVRRVDGRGRTRWVRHYGSSTSVRDLTPLPDGSYALLTADPNRFPLPVNVHAYDAWVLQITPRGDTVRAAYVGDSAVHEIASRLIATSDGGLALVGVQAAVPSWRPRRGILFKLDSAWHEQWRYSYAPTTGNFDEGGEIVEVKQLANGHFLVAGASLGKGEMHEVAPGGSAVWDWYIPQASPNPFNWPKVYQLAYDSALLAWRTYGGGIAPNHSIADIWLTTMINLPPPAPAPDPCAVPPGPPAASFQPAGGPATLRFTLDVVATPAGPRYADISRVTWDFGDGTAPDTGRTVLHTYAAPTPVRVRCTITNNRFCHRSTDLFPFGPGPGVGLPQAAPLPAVHLWPNPSATGRFEVRLADSEGTQPTGWPAYAVLDATGRTLLAGTLRPATTPLDLRPQPAGVYALRLRWPNGRTTSRRIVRW